MEITVIHHELLTQRTFNVTELERKFLLGMESDCSYLCHISGVKENQHPGLITSLKEKELIKSWVEKDGRRTDTVVQQTGWGMAVVDKLLESR